MSTGIAFPYTTRNDLSGYETGASHGRDDHLSLPRRVLRRRQAPRHLREHDVGLWWLGDDWQTPRFRAAWVDQTGEPDLMQHEGTPGGGRVDVVATAGSLDEIERCLDGWREVVGEWGSLRWLVERLGPEVPAAVRRAAGLLSETPRFEHPVAPRTCSPSWPSSAQGTSTESSVGESRATT